MHLCIFLQTLVYAFDEGFCAWTNQAVVDFFSSFFGSEDVCRLQSGQMLGYCRKIQFGQFNELVYTMFFEQQLLRHPESDRMA